MIFVNDLPDAMQCYVQMFADDTKLYRNPARSPWMLPSFKKTSTLLNASMLTRCPFYMTFIQPHLEYCNVIWGPFNKADQQKVERVQRRATKLILSL